MTADALRVSRRMAVQCATPAIGLPKKLLGRSSLVRDLLREHRLRSGHPRWRDSLDQFPGRAGETTVNGTVLLATVGGGYLAGTSVESLLGLALTERGADVHVLLCDGMMPACLECNADWYPNVEKFAQEGPTRRHCRACFEPAKRTYADTGVTLHRYSELLNADEIKAAQMLADTVPIEAIPAFEIDGVRVGEHAYAGTLRFFARATLETNALSEVVLRRYLKAALLTYHAISRLLRKIEFTASVSHHGIYVPQGIIGDVARKHGVRVVNWHVAYRKNCFIFSEGDTYHHTLLHEPTSSWETMRWTASAEATIKDYLSSRWMGTDDWISFSRPEIALRAIESEIGVDFEKPCIGMLTNVMWDAQLHYAANAFPSMLAWAVKTISYFANRPELQLLIRVHPAEISGTLRSRQPFIEAIEEHFETLPGNVFIIPPRSKISTYAAMEPCNAVLIYGTKTGVELSAMGIPVITAGEAWIRNKGITDDAVSEADYLEKLDGLPFGERLPQDVVSRALKYAFHFFFRRMIPIEYARETSGSPGFEWQVTRLGELSKGASAGLDVICDGVLHGTPFIFPAEELLDSRRREPEHPI